MPKSKSQKEQIIKDLQDKLHKSKSMVFANFDGLKVADATELKRECRKEGMEYLVAKKTLFQRALKDSGLENVGPENLSGSLAVIMGYEDEVAPAKTVSKFAKTHEALKIIGGVLENKFVDVTVVSNLSKLPSKQELIARVVGSVRAPLSGLVNVLQGNLRGLVYVLNAVREKKQ